MVCCSSLANYKLQKIKQNATVLTGMGICPGRQTPTLMLPPRLQFFELGSESHLTASIAARPSINIHAAWAGMSIWIVRPWGALTGLDLGDTPCRHSHTATKVNHLPVCHNSRIVSPITTSYSHYWPMPWRRSP